MCNRLSCRRAGFSSSSSDVSLFSHSYTGRLWFLRVRKPCSTPTTSSLNVKNFCLAPLAVNADFPVRQKAVLYLRAYAVWGRSRSILAFILVVLAVRSSFSPSCFSYSLNRNATGHLRDGGILCFPLPGFCLRYGFSWNQAHSDDLTKRLFLHSLPSYRLPCRMRHDVLGSDWLGRLHCSDLLRDEYAFSSLLLRSRTC